MRSNLGLLLQDLGRFYEAEECFRRATLARMLYAAKCYWPGVTHADLQQVAGRAAATGLAAGAGPVTYLGCLLFAADDLVLCLFSGGGFLTISLGSGVGFRFSS